MPIPLCAALRPTDQTGDPYMDLAGRARRLDFDGLMLGFAPERDPARARQALADHHLVVAEVGCYVNLLHPEDRHWQANIDRVKAALRQAKALGARCVASIAGSLAPDMNTPHPDNWSPRAWQRLYAALAQILPVAEEVGVFFCLEPFILTPLDSVRALRRVLDDNPSPWLGVLLDPVNLVSHDRYFHTGDLIDEAFDRLGTKIQCIHAKDTLWVPRAFTLYLKEVPPGAGVLDYPRLLRRLAQLGNGAPLCLEHLASDEEYAAAAAHLRRVAAEIGVSLGSPREHEERDRR